MIIAIDPSINETGWACHTLSGEMSGVIKTKGSLDTDKIKDLCFHLRLIIESCCINEAIIEVAEGFTYKRSANEFGKAKNAMAMYKNGMSVGAIMGLFAMLKISMSYVGATEWKGRLGKGHTKSFTGKSNDNEADALMLLRWHLAGKR